MDLSFMLADSRAILDIISYLLIIASCGLILGWTRSIYRLTHHTGIKAFRYAFLFSGLAFAVRLAGLVFTKLFESSPSSSMSPILILAQMLFTFLLSLGGLYLVYSLLWKEFETRREPLFYLISAVVSIVTLFWSSMIFVSQIAALSVGLVVSYSNYKAAQASGKRDFTEFYFIAVVLALISFAINWMMRQFFSLSWFSPYTSLLNATVFIIYAIGVASVLKWPKKEKD
jgi:hypothetical protein